MTGTGMALASVFMALLAVLALVSPPASAADVPGDIPGQKPAYTDRMLTAPPNDAAMVRRAWAPGIDDGYVPQGVTATADAVYLSAYLQGGAGRGCRVFRLDPARLR